MKTTLIVALIAFAAVTAAQARDNTQADIDLRAKLTAEANARHQAETTAPAPTAKDKYMERMDAEMIQRQRVYQRCIIAAEGTVDSCTTKAGITALDRLTWFGEQ